MTTQEVWEHQQWLGLLQPIGLVVAPLALVKHQCYIDRNSVIPLQKKLQEVITFSEKGKLELRDFGLFTQVVLNWLPEDLITEKKVGSDSWPTVPLPDYGEILAPSYGVQDPDTGEWILLIKEVERGLNFDAVHPHNEKGNGWKVSIQAKFERLLRETQIPIGILFNGTEIRLVYAPRGESSGYLTFPLSAMVEVAGRTILGALVMLLGSYRLFDAPSNLRLGKILSSSRDYQAEVSTQLANQVLDALWELLRGFQSANVASDGLLFAPFGEDKISSHGAKHIYGGLITTLMRLVFLLYAEDEGLMPDDAIYQQNYSVSGLYERLREDLANYPDTMDMRYGAWPWLLSLFRLVYDGGGSVPEYLPARHGQLFNPDEYPFLEGRTINSSTPTIPRITDGVIYRVLNLLLMLNGERLSYRALDVEQIGSVYEAIMGYEVEVAVAPSIGVKSKPKGSKYSTTIVINLQALLMAKASERSKLLKEWADCDLTGNNLKELKSAKTIEEIVVALDKKISDRTTTILSQGSLYLQPGEERRRTGSHYTPRQLTEPIVQTTLKPIFEQLGEHPTPEQILDLKVCDLAMGSAAFLVEACRQLAEKLVASWNYYQRLSEIPANIEPLLYARRLVAQRCLYGVDKNPFAVNLAKLSLWLVTLAKDLPFTFVDHALKCGDSLVGLTSREIGSFGKDTSLDLPLMKLLRDKIDRAKSYRQEIQAADTQTDSEAENKFHQWQQAELELEETRLISKVKVAAFFSGTKPKEREQNLTEYGNLVRQWREFPSEATLSPLHALENSLTQGEKPLIPFNWEAEFPEVFQRDNPGFDVIIGNPPFAGKNTTINGNPDGYLDWLKIVHPEAHGNSDLVAHFFRRAFTIVRKQGTLGLIATNTIAQGDTRTTGLRFICNNGGTIYNAQKRVKWHGLAAVVVSVVNIIKGDYQGTKTLDGRTTDNITAFLFHAGGNDDPAKLKANENKSFQGSIVLGMGFTFDDSNPSATPISEMHRLIADNPKNSEVIFPYIGGEEVNSSPTHSHHRYVINFGEMSEQEARDNYPDLMAIVEQKVKPDRDKQKDKGGKQLWWQFLRSRGELKKAIAPLDRVLVTACGATKYFAPVFLPANCIFSHALAVFAINNYSVFGILQCSIHEIWARFLSSSMKDDLRYTPSDCFETYPFPIDLDSTEPLPIKEELDDIGKTYYEYRADLMVRNNQGLTDTYNRFHDPYETDPAILKLRELHDTMDRTVLKAYGWEDIDTTCGFSLDYLDLDNESDLPPDVQDRIANHDYFFNTADEAMDFDNIVRTGKRKLPWRYRWCETTHDEVLARLLDLNQQRAREESIRGVESAKKTTPKGKKTKANEGQGSLF